MTDHEPMPTAEVGEPPKNVRRDGGHKQVGTAALTLGALGVVFGDIGTSPLYSLHAVFAEEGVKPDAASVYGIISLVVWSVTAIVSIKYVTFVMRADNDGEGGIMALIALVHSAVQKAHGRAALIALGIFGAALFYGDGIITPAISVLSAVEGLEIVSPDLESVVVPIAIVIIALLFMVQRFGTQVVGRFFGPVMALWFSVLAISGIAQIADDPGVLKALSPTYAIEFFAEDFGVAFLSLGAVVLAVTGAEALYADMGHFGRAPIRRAWFFFVFPALTLNYLGQGSLIVQSPSAVENPFFLLVPHWSRIPLVVLATAATVIASQAVISGAFSVTRQAVQLGFLPRLTIRHTSPNEVGQVYLPAINAVLFVAVLALVIGFGSSGALASAYGVAVTGTFAIDTILFFVVVRVMWGKPKRLVFAGAAAFLFVDLAFLGANLPKVDTGGWFPLLIAAVVFTVLMTWQRGRELVTAARESEEGPLQEFVDYLHELEPPIYRTPGTGVFLNASKETTPLAMRANVVHNRTLHESVVILTIETTKTPHVPRDERITVDDLGYRDDGITHVTARFGFLDHPDVPDLLRRAEGDVECKIDIDTCSYFLSRITIIQTDRPGMAVWRKKLFVNSARLSADPIVYFGLPIERTVTMGQPIDF